MDTRRAAHLIGLGGDGQSRDRNATGAGAVRFGLMQNLMPRQLIGHRYGRGLAYRSPIIKLALRDTMPPRYQPNLAALSVNLR